MVEKLHPEADLISGDVKPFSMVEGLDDTFTGALFLGYHARASTPGVMPLIPGHHNNRQRMHLIQAHRQADRLCKNDGRRKSCCVT